MSINSISGTPVQSITSASATTSKTGSGTGFTVNRFMTQADAIGGGATVRYRSSMTDTVSLSCEAFHRKGDSYVYVDTEMTDEMKSAAIPPWLASYYPGAGRVGMSALECDRLTAQVDKLSVGEKAQYYKGLQRHIREMTLENKLGSTS